MEGCKVWIRIFRIRGHAVEVHGMFMEADIIEKKTEVFVLVWLE